MTDKSCSRFQEAIKGAIAGMKDAYAAVDVGLVMFGFLSLFGIEFALGELPPIVTYSSVAVAYIAGSSVSRFRASKEIAELPTKEQLAEVEKRAEVAEAECDSVRKSLDLATANAERELSERGENLESVRVRQELLNELAGARTPKMMQRIILDRLDESRPSDNQKYGAALRDLVRYGCVSGVNVPDFANDGTYVPYTSDALAVTRGDYPSLRERERMDLLEEVQGMISETVRQLIRGAEIARRE